MSKKMCSSQNKKNSFKADILQYKPAVYAKRSKVKYVYFYVLDPQSVLDGSPKLKRIRTKFNCYASARERDAAALRYRDEINKKLTEGWNPLIESSAKKSFTPTEDVLSSYSRQIAKKAKDGVLKKNTYEDYCKRLKRFQKYIEGHPVPYVYMIDRQYVDGYLDYIYVDGDCSPRTRNNHLSWLSSLCAYFVDYGYITTNPCIGIKPLRNGEKFRKALEEEDRIMLFAWLKEYDPYFLLACQFQYYTLIRPGELCCLRLKDISLKEQTVFVSHEYSKNRKDGVATLPKVVIETLITLKVFDYPSSYYLFGKNFKPSQRKSAANHFAKRWAEVRDALKLPMCYQFYSLKDTGITNIINKVGLNIAKDQARHSSVAVTNHYASKNQMHAQPELKNYE